MNYAVTPRQIPVNDFIAGIEAGIKNLSGEKVDFARQKILGILANAKPPNPNIPSSLYYAMKGLREREDIVILPADKGRCTVVMDKDVYNEKVMTLLEDGTTYRKLKKDPTTTAENKMNAMLLGLKNKGILTEGLYRQLRSSGGQIPLFYGLPKTIRPGPHRDQ